MLVSLELENFRCIERATIELDPEGTGIVGPNGSGKTSLLEALYFLGHGRSFRTGVRARLIGQHAPYFRVVGRVRVGERELTAGAEFGGGKTQARLAGEGVSSISAIAEILPTQVIDPGVHRLIEEGSARRRRLLDWGVFHVKHDFLHAWRRYQRALAQRNAALRAALGPDLVHSWDGELADTAARIDEARARYVTELTPTFCRLAERLLGLGTTIAYRRGWPEGQQLAEALQTARDRDTRSKATTLGPHRADLVFNVDGALARDWVSRGQQKLLAAAFVLAQISVRADHNAEPTCLLLDDPAAELDVDNLGKLLEVIGSIPAQLIVTSLDIAGLSGIRIGKRFHVERGRFASVL